MYASHLINRLPSAALNGKTPLEVWSGLENLQMIMILYVCLVPLLIIM